MESKTLLSGLPVSGVSWAGLSLGLALLLAGCGGGGGGGGGLASGSGGGFSSDSSNNGGLSLSITPPPVTEPTVTPQEFETSEYFLSTGLSRIKASSAYAKGATGTGVVVAVVDSGIDLQHPDFAGAIHSASRDIIASRNQLDDQAGHGTLVSGIIGARRNESQVQGVAFNSQILAIRADSNIGNCVNCYSDIDIANATNYAAQNGAKVINYSLSGPDAVSQTLLNAFRNAAAADVVLVAAAGNNYAQPTEYPAALANDTQIGGRLIAVGAVDQNNQIASFSARPLAGSEQYFVVAPGVSVLTTSNGGYIQAVSGTSFASSYVSGAIAVLRSHAPYVSAQQIVNQLLSTTTDLGAAGTDGIYGRGLINLEAALAPAGAASVPTGNSVFGGGTSFNASSVRLGSAFGDGLKRQAALQQGVFIDDLGRAYLTDYGRNVSKARATPALQFVEGVDSQSVQLMQAGLAPALALSGDTRTAGARIDATTPVYFSAGSGKAAIVVTNGYGIESGFGFAERMAKEGQVSTLSQGSASGYLSLMGNGPAATGSLAVSEDVKLRTGLAFREAQDDPLKLDRLSAQGQRVAFVSEVGVAVRTTEEAGEVGFRFGGIHEEGTGLDSRSSGAFSLGAGAKTQFVGTYANLPVSKDTAVFATYETGFTKFDASETGLLRNFSLVRSEGFSLGFSTRNALVAKDRLTLTFAQPLKVVDAAADLVLPTGVDQAGNVQRAAQRLALKPSGRQMDAELGYEVGLRAGETLSFKAMISREPGHDKSAGPAALIGLRFTKKFGVEK